MVIKGVNKQVIEVNCTQSDTFDRILLFVNPEVCCSNQQLDVLALKFAQQYFTPSSKTHKINAISLIKSGIKWLSVFGMGSLAAVVLGYWLP